MQVKIKGSGKFDSEKVLKPSRKVLIRTLYRTGGLIQKIARRSLRKARKIRVSELPDDAREKYREDLEDFNNGYRKTPPVLRDIISDPGNPPLLHQTPSPLKHLLHFKVDEQNQAVFVGPRLARSGIADELEYGRGKVKQARPFMRPALAKALPKIPGYLR